MDGNPYEVAGRGVAQLRGILRLAQLSMPAVELMARNAEMERQMALDQEPDVTDWDTSPVGRKFAYARTALSEVADALEIVERAVSFDPRHPPKP
jgi:hypothetical protein